MTLGIAGTAKNTGKTTTLSVIMDEIKKEDGLVLGLTSIGYDGESFDNVTGLPKPRINVWPGNIVAIAEECNKFCSAELKPIKETNIRTPLGKVVISRVTSAGKVVLAGANNRRELRIVLDMLNELSRIIIVDGALSRIAPMVETDCLILVTGAARYTEIPRLALESSCMVQILSTPQKAVAGSVKTVGSILSQSGFDALVESCLTADTVRINGVISEKYLKELISFSDRLAEGNLRHFVPRCEVANKHLIFDDPIKLLLAGEAMQVWKHLQELKTASIEIGVEKTLDLLAMTVNPYFPKYRFSKADYEEAFVDADELLKTVSEKVIVPCYDVVKQGGKAIFKMIMERNYS